MKMYWLVLLVGLLLLSVQQAESKVRLVHAYRWSRVLSATGAYTLHWNITSTTLYVGLTADVVGWMSFGVSPSGLMLGGDVAVGWVSGGTGVALGYQTIDYSQPPLDTANSVTFIAGSGDGTPLLPLRRHSPILFRILSFLHSMRRFFILVTFTDSVVLRFRSLCAQQCHWQSSIRGPSRH